MGGRHAKKKYKVKKDGKYFIVVIQGTDARVAGLPAYEVRADAQAEADRLNK